MRHVERVHARVDLADGLLRRGRVELLDDADDLAVLRAQNPAVPRRVGHRRRHHRRGSGFGTVGGDQVGKGFGVHQRNVARRHHHGAGELGGQGGQPAGDGVPGAALLLLDGDINRAAKRLGQLGHGRSDAFAVMAQHHDQVLRGDLGDRVQNVRQHAAARQGVQHLRGVRPHPGACACGHHQDRGLAVLSHLSPPRLPLAPSPGLEPELSEPKSEVLPITPRRTDQPVMVVQATRLPGVAVPEKELRAPRARMTGAERRHQLIDIARSLFAERGYEGTSVEEIAQRANVSKPVVYEHFGGKEGLYAVVVDREMSALLDGITSSLTRTTNNRSRLRIERVTLALLTYVDERTDGFRILIRDSPAAITSGTYSTLLNDAVNQVSSILAGDFSRRGLDPDMAPLYAQALVGSVSMTAQWWLDVREPKKEVVAAHLVNLCWNGLMHLEDDPQLLDE